MSATILSVIIPVFNGAAHIEAALVSLTSQLAPGVQILVLNDGSTDDTAKIVAGRFSTYLDSGALRLISQPNGGVSVARNAGIDAAAGAYLGFFDADDIALPGYIEKILEAIKQDIDIVEFAYKSFASATHELADRPTSYTNRRFGVHRAPAVLNVVYGIARWYPWSRVFRATLFDGIRFPPGVRMCEDVMTIPRLYEKAHAVLNLAEPLYGYRTNPDGATLNVQSDYVPNLEQFYRTIPRSGARHHDYLRLTIGYAICSCLLRLDGTRGLSQEIAADMRRLRYVPSVYRDIEPRKIGIMLYPALFYFLKRLATFRR